MPGCGITGSGAAATLMAPGAKLPSGWLVTAGSSESSLCCRGLSRGAVGGSVVGGEGKHPSMFLPSCDSPAHRQWFSEHEQRPRQINVL